MSRNPAQGTDYRPFRILVLVALALIVAIWLLFAAGAPLGVPGRFVYTYSPIIIRRLLEMPTILIPASILATSVIAAAHHRVTIRRLGIVLGVAGMAALAVWTLVAPPDPWSQHAFNLQTPSQDGAFLIEAATIENVRDYLRAFPERARKPPAEMKGTRVVSNPPGTTLVAYAVRAVLIALPALERQLETQLPDPTLSAPERQRLAWTFSLAVVMTVLWAAALPLLYGAARVVLAPPAALTVAICATATPMTVLFTPGKDPAQLFTVAVFLWLWMTACRPWFRVREPDHPAPARGPNIRSGVAAALAGTALVVGLLLSLVHVWIAAIVALATFAHARRVGAWGRWLGVVGLPCALGLILAMMGLQGLADGNLLEIAAATARAQSGVTRGPDAMPWRWQALGIPLFLLLCGPALWAGWLALLAGRTRGSLARFGATLSIVTALVLIATVGFTNVETPRLWIPFTPLLLLGASLQLPVMRRRSRWHVSILTTLVAAQILVSAAQWAMLDVRGAEARLLGEQPAYFWAPTQPAIER